MRLNAVRTWLKVIALREIKLPHHRKDREYRQRVQKQGTSKDAEKVESRTYTGQWSTVIRKGQRTDGKTETDKSKLLTSISSGWKNGSLT